MAKATQRRGVAPECLTAVTHNEGVGASDLTHVVEWAWEYCPDRAVLSFALVGRLFAPAECAFAPVGPLFGLAALLFALAALSFAPAALSFAPAALLFAPVARVSGQRRRSLYQLGRRWQPVL